MSSGTRPPPPSESPPSAVTPQVPVDPSVRNESDLEPGDLELDAPTDPGEETIGEHG